MTPTGWSRRWRPVAGWSMPDRSSTIGVRSAPAARTTCGARTTSRRGTPSIETVASTPAARPCSTQDPLDGRVGDDPRPVLPRLGEVDPDPRLLRAPPAAEPAPAAVAAVDAVPPDLADLLAEHRAAAEDQLVLGRDVRGVGHADLGGQRREVRVERRVLEAREPMGGRPVAARRGRRVDAGHPVDEGPAADARAGQGHDRCVPRHVEAVVEVQPVERAELVGRHLGLRHERTRLEHDDRPPGVRQVRGQDAAARSRADDGDVRIEHQRLARGGATGDGPEVERPDRRRVRGHRLGHDVEPDRREARVDAGLARIGIGEEREQALEPLVRRAALRDARGGPREEVGLAGRLVEVREADRASGEQQVRGAGFERGEHELELADLGGIRGEVQRGGCQACPSLGIAADDRVTDRRKGRERCGRPSHGVRGRRTRYDGSRGNGCRGGGHLRRDHNDTQPLLVAGPRRPASIRRMVHAWEVADAQRVVPPDGVRPAETPAPPADSPVLSFLRRVHDRHRLDDTGMVASYIPELAGADPAAFGIVIATVDGAVYEIGDTRTPFTIQSMAKPLTYAAILDRVGPVAVRQRIGVEPTGDAFNAISLGAGTGMPLNPMVNAGAITAVGLDAGRRPGRGVDALVGVARAVRRPAPRPRRGRLRLGARHRPSQPGDRTPPARHRRDRRRPRRGRRRVLQGLRRLGHGPRPRAHRRHARQRRAAPAHRGAGRVRRHRPRHAVGHGHVRHVRRRGRVDVRGGPAGEERRLGRDLRGAARASWGSASGRRRSTRAATASAASPSAATSPASSTSTSCAAPGRRRAVRTRGERREPAVEAGTRRPRARADLRATASGRSSSSSRASLGFVAVETLAREALPDRRGGRRRRRRPAPGPARRSRRRRAARRPRRRARGSWRRGRLERRRRRTARCCRGSTTRSPSGGCRRRAGSRSWTSRSSGPRTSC